METPKYKTALIVGAGEGLSASLARLFAKQGIRVALAARQIPVRACVSPTLKLATEARRLDTQTP